MKILSAVLATALCSLAIVAASASASGFVVNNEPAGATYTGTGEVTLNYSVFSNNCTILLAGTMSASSESLVPSMTSINCGENGPKFNGCSLTKLIAGAEHPPVEYEPGEFTSQYFDGEIEYGPKGCGPVTDDTNFSKGDKIYLNEKGTATYTNQGSGSTKTVTVQFKDYGQYELGPPNKPGLHAGAELTGTITLKAEQCCGKQAPIEIRSETLTALGINSSPLQFTSARYPVNIHTAKFWEIQPVWSARGSYANCSKADYTTSGLAAATSTLDLRPELSGCSWAGLPAAAFRNGCTYKFALTSSTGGTFSISCSAGNSMEFLSYVKATELAEGKYTCKLAIPPQSGTFTVSAVNGSLRPNVSISKLKYTHTRNSFLCPAGAGTFEDGSFSQEMKLAGSY